MNGVYDLLQFSFEIFLGLLALFGFLSFVVYFEWLPLEWGFGVHCMVHSCSDGFDEEIEWLFQLKGDGGIETMFQ